MAADAAPAAAYVAADACVQVRHFMDEYERYGTYRGVPCAGFITQVQGSCAAKQVAAQPCRALSCLQACSAA